MSRRRSKSTPEARMGGPVTPSAMASAADALPNFGKCVAAVRREMLGDAERRKKFRVVRQNFRRRVTAVKFAEQAGDGFDHQRIGSATERTMSGAEFRNKPKPGETAGNQICIQIGRAP